MFHWGPSPGLVFMSIKVDSNLRIINNKNCSRILQIARSAHSGHMIVMKLMESDDITQKPTTKSMIDCQILT